MIIFDFLRFLQMKNCLKIYILKSLMHHKLKMIPFNEHLKYFMVMIRYTWKNDCLVIQTLLKSAVKVSDILINFHILLI